MIAVIILILVGATVAYFGFVTWSRELERANTKKARIPKQAYSEAGICQCDDAFAYHNGDGRCQVPNCPCARYVDSAMVASEKFKEAVMDTIPRHLALEPPKSGTVHDPNKGGTVR